MPLVSSISKLNLNKNQISFKILHGLRKIPGIENKPFRTQVANLNVADGIIDSFGSGIQKQQWTATTSQSEVFIASTNSSDLTQTVRVRYLNLAFLEQTVTITLNGQTEVSINSPANDFYRIRDFSVRTNKPNLGDIYLYTVSGNTAGIPNDLTSLQGILEAGIGTYVDFMYTPRLHTTGVLFSIFTSTSGKQNADITTRTVIIGVDGIRNIGGSHIFPSGSNVIDDGTLTAALPAGVTGLTSLSTDTNGVSFTQRAAFLEVENSTFDAWLNQGISGVK